MGCNQRACHHLRLGERQRRCAGAEFQLWTSHKACSKSIRAGRKAAMSHTPIILGLESSCDETAVALVTADRRILAQRIAGQEEAHRPFGGVVPELAARAPVEILAPLVEQVLAEAGPRPAPVDAKIGTAAGRGRG